MRSLLNLAAAGLLATLAAVSEAQTGYHVQTLPGIYPSDLSSLQVSVVEDDGSFAGTYARTIYEGHGVVLHPATPFLYRGGAVENLAPGDDYDSARVTAINASGAVVGSVVVRPSEYEVHVYGFLNDGGATTFFPEGELLGDINDAGVGVGALNATPTSQAAIYRNGVLTALQPVAAFYGGRASTGQAINDAGQIIGRAVGSDGPDHSFFLDGDTLTDLGAVNAVRINASGMVVGGYATGQYEDDYRYRSFVWQNGVRSDLGALGPQQHWGDTIEVQGLNDAGQAVGGVYGNFAHDPLHGFLWQNGTMTDLSSLVDGGWTINTATAISNNGTIAALATRNGVTSAVLLRPVPEPASLAALGLGLVAVLRRRRRA